MFEESKIRTEFGPNENLRLRNEQGSIIRSPEEDIREPHDQPSVIFIYLIKSLIINYISAFFIKTGILIKMKLASTRNHEGASFHTSGRIKIAPELLARRHFKAPSVLSAGGRPFGYQSLTDDIIEKEEVKQTPFPTSDFEIAVPDSEVFSSRQWNFGSEGVILNSFPESLISLAVFGWFWSKIQIFRCFRLGIPKL